MRIRKRNLPSSEGGGWRGGQMDCGRKSRQTEGGGRGIFTNGMRNQTKGWKEQTVGEAEDKQMGCEQHREQTRGSCRGAARMVGKEK